MKHWITLLLVASACDTIDDAAELERQRDDGYENERPFRNALGTSATWSAVGYVDMTGEFFQELGTNGRHCGHCHAPDQGWTVAADRVRAVFESTGGLDPIFRTNDGTTSPTADVSTLEARRTAYAMLLSRGVFRVGIAMPADAELELIAVDDPYGHASAAELSLFRRPLPATNLTFAAQVMWDGRMPTLSDQANGATMGHAARPDPIAQEIRDAIVGFESALFTAQVRSRIAGPLDAAGARGGPAALARQTMVAGRFDLFDAWATSKQPARAAVYRGQELFNTRLRRDGRSSCQGCHSVQNVGTSASGKFFDVGVSSRRAPDQPLYTLRQIATGEVVTTTDPGRALITGKWADVGRFKVPALRGLAARAPYFHDGSAETLAEVVAFYQDSLGFNFTRAEAAELVAFLSAL